MFEIISSHLALPTIFHIFSNYVPMEERSRSFSYLIALGSVGQTFAALVGRISNFLLREYVWF